MNRRIPNGTYGGVRGWGLVTPTYSIAVICGHPVRRWQQEEDGLVVRWMWSLLLCVAMLCNSAPAGAEGQKQVVLVLANRLGLADLARMPHLHELAARGAVGLMNVNTGGGRTDANAYATMAFGAPARMAEAQAIAVNAGEQNPAVAVFGGSAERGVLVPTMPKLLREQSKREFAGSIGGIIFAFDMRRDLVGEEARHQGADGRHQKHHADENAETRDDREYPLHDVEGDVPTRSDGALDPNPAAAEHPRQQALQGDAENDQQHERDGDRFPKHRAERPRGHLREGLGSGVEQHPFLREWRRGSRPRAGVQAAASSLASARNTSEEPMHGVADGEGAIQQSQQAFLDCFVAFALG